MKKLPIYLLLIITQIHLWGQSEINGVITDKNQLPIIGANISVLETYDGGISEVDGSFSFNTSEESEIILSFSYLGYETQNIKGLPQNLIDLKITLRESAMTLDAVEITASTFKAGDNSKVAVLKPLDILTTAGSMGDVMAAMQTLPGTQSNADDGRLFVRGGDARETAIYIDGLRVFSPYTRTIGGSPTRGRYSPMLFKGVSFSTGGYSTAYGQALSGALDMQTIDEPSETVTNFNLMSVGLGLGHTQKWVDQSISFNGSYTNLTPYDKLFPSRINWENPYAGFSGEAIHRLKTNNGLLKTYIAVDKSDLSLNRSDFITDNNQRIAITNKNIYGNSNYLSFINERTSINAGISAGINRDNSILDEEYSTNNYLLGYHARLGAKTIMSSRSTASYGVDLMHLENKKTLTYLDDESQNKLTRNIAGGFLETDYFFNKNLAIKTGLRLEYNSALSNYNLLPRVTIAQKLSKNGQVSASYGWFNQEVDSENLLLNNSLDHENAKHYILNYNLKTAKQILRVETYYKQYDKLISYDITNGEKSTLGNLGDGYAYGLDLFYRANQVIDNLDMWISYSWLENQRKFKNYPVATPTSFSTRHNLSVVGKYFVNDWKSQLSLTYQMASGRPYHDPNMQLFMSERSKYYHSINMSWAYLISPQKILFVSVNNVTRFKNSYGYEFKSIPDGNGYFDSQLIRPNDDQFFFVGFFITLSKNKLNNQLNNL